MDRRKWEYKKLGDICILLNGFAFKSEKYVDNGIRVMRITNVQKGEIVDDDPKFYPMSSQSEIQRYMLQENDLLVSLTGNVGRVGLLQRELLPAALNQRVACLRIKDDSIDLKYIFHLTNSDLFENECIVNSQGIAQKNMSTKWLSDYKLPVPPLADQQRIVAELDCLNEMIAVKQEQLKEFDKLAQSIFYDMFGDPVENEKGWKHCLLKDVSEAITDRDHMPPPKSDSGVPFVTISNVKKDTRQIDFSNTFFVPREYYDKIPECKKARIGDVLYTVTGSYGIPIIIREDKEFCFQRHIGLIRPNKGIEPIFLCMWAGCQSIKKYADRYATGVAQKTVSLKVLRNFPMIVPPLFLQQQFAEKISAIEAQKELVKQSIAETQHLLDYTMDKYFG